MAEGEKKLEVKDEREKIWEQPQSQAVEVKSTAMVKSARKHPVYHFSRLDRNTDLHRPPDNWLRSDAQLSKTWVTGECTQFSSFAMAETLPDTVGEVDVISAAENIKKLLKIPFSKAQVSMAVHCVGKTLLLDELDLFKQLRSASKRERDWMKRFLIEAVLSEGKSLTMKRKTNELLQNSNLLSKFLYYSIGNRSEESEPQQTFDFEEQHLPPNQSALIQIPHLLPKMKPSEFARQALWQFEDIRMLIGTDLPIFGEGIHPAVSLRLKDMSSPINVLTGLDYWLDNLMSNVPELAMCYHLNGIVQKYELLKTEEIPNLEDAKFSPQVINDVAQNILSFLKSHCTKEGHTYWLFKGQDEDVVKLYDLTSLCNEYPNRPWENPFISPVAMLLYRVARNMSMAKPNKKDKGTIHKLLKNCLQLLEGSGDRHPEVAASASHLLSHIFINEDDLSDPPPGSAATGPQKAAKKSQPQQPDSSSGEDEDELVLEDGVEPREASLNVPTMSTESLMLPSGSKPGGGGFKERHQRRRRRSAKTIYASKEEKAKVALLYIVKGLKSIMECPESTETAKEQAAKIPSPQSSPTRARPLYYPIRDSQSLTGRVAAKGERLGVCPDKELQTEGTFGVTWDGQEPIDQSVSEKTRRDSETSGNQVLAVDSPSGVLGETLLELKQPADSKVVAPPSPEAMSVAGFPDAEGFSGEVLELETRHNDLPTNFEGLNSRIEGSTLSGLTVGVTPLHRDPPDGPVKDGPASIETLSLLPAVSDTKVSLLPSSLPTDATRSWHPGSWQYKLSFLLLKKAWETYLVLSKAARDAERYGQALHLADMSLLCRSACMSLKLPEETGGPNLLSDQLTVCGDCLVLLSHNLAAYARQREEFQVTTAEDRWILGAVRQHDCTNDYEWAVDFQNNLEHNLRTGILSYTLALSEAAGHADGYVIMLTRKQGNARNELGVYHMNQALALRNEKAGLEKEQDMWRKSLSCFESGIEIFESVKDVANVSLLLCNIGKLMRLCAFSFGETEPSPSSEMTQKERYYFNKATDYYQRALSRLGQRKRNPSLWESVTWELSSTYFAMATILQDHPPLSYMAQEQVEKDIIELMNKALSLCEVDDITPVKQPVYQYRAGTIHHRLASMHHNAYRNMSSQQKQKHTRSLSELHYQKAVRLFQDLDRPAELLRVLLERVALLEHQFEGQSGVSARIKTLHSALETLLQCQDTLSTIHRTKTKEAADSPTSSTRTAEGTSRVATCMADQTLESCQLNEEGDVCGDPNDLQEVASGQALRKSSGPLPVAGSQGSSAPSETAPYGDGQEQGEPRTDEEGSPAGSRRATDPAEAARSPRPPASSGVPAQQRTTMIPPSSSTSAASEKPPTELPRPRAQMASEIHETGSTGEEGQGSNGGGQGSRGARDGLTKDEEDERQRLEAMWESRLQYVLLNLVRLHGTNKKGGQHVAVYKKMYAASLGRTLPPSLPSSMAMSPAATTTLAGISEEVRQLYQTIK